MTSLFEAMFLHMNNEWWPLLILHPLLFAIPALLIFTIYRTVAQEDFWFFRRPGVIITASLIGAGLGIYVAWTTSGLIEASPIKVIDGDFFGPLWTANKKADDLIELYFDPHFITESLIIWAVTAALLIPRITRVLFLALISTWWFFDVVPYLALSLVHLSVIVIAIPLFALAFMLTWGGLAYRR
jgi:hypothetical protein